MEQKRSRPANRPSRRSDILKAATELLSVQLPDDISVADITAHAGMTPAAFYYHFAGKTDLIDELVASFGEQWRAAVASWLAEVGDADGLGEVVDALLAWLDENQRAATVYFVNSTAVSEHAEDTKRAIRNELYDEAITAVRRLGGGQPAATTAVAGVALVVLLEVTARSRLSLDESYRGLGPVRFRATATNLSRSLVAWPA